MTDNEETLSKRKRKYVTSFSNMSQEDAEKILGFRFARFYCSQKPLDQFTTKKAPQSWKKEIFQQLVHCLDSEGYPEASILPLNQAVVTDYVGTILRIMVAYCNRTMKHSNIQLTREKQIISNDEQIGEDIEFVVIHNLTENDVRYVIVVEAKRDSLGNGLTQLLLAMKSTFDINNDQKLVYGFVTTAIDWQLITFDGQRWNLYNRSTILFGSMKKQEDLWLNNFTQILDIIYYILSSLESSSENNN